MKYTYNNKTFEIPDSEVDKIMDSLDISLAEACEMYLFDHDLIVNDTAEELTAKAQKNRVTATIHQAKGEKKPRKAREKKINPLKKELIQIIYKALFSEVNDIHSITVTNDEKYIDITVGDREFTVNLVEHRKKKN